MSEVASAAAANNINWIQQAQNNPVEFLKNLDDLLDDFGPQELANAGTQQFISKFVDSLRQQINCSHLPQGIKDAANALLEAHAAGVSENCPCSAEASDAVASSAQSEAINHAAEGTAEEVVATANDSTSAGGAAPAAPALSTEAQAEADAEEINEGVGGGYDSMDELQSELGQVEKDDEKGKGNWLVVLAGTMADIQSKFLNEAMEQSRIMEGEAGIASEGGKSDKFLAAQSAYTANMQLFNIFSQQVATSIKTIGEALASISRKQ